jgi:hypothetical protein
LGWSEKEFRTNDGLPDFRIMVALMFQEQHQQNEWARAKALRSKFSFPQLLRLAQDGLIRTSHIRRPGQTRGVRLFHVGDLNALIAESVEPPRVAPSSQGRSKQSLRNNPESSGNSVD